MLSLATLLTSTLAFAAPLISEASEPTSAQVSAEKVVQTKLVQPLAAKESERSRFSRARLPPQTRRIRVLDSEPKKDGEGAAFVRYAIDARYGFMALEVDGDSEGGWRKDTIVGCVYVDKGEVFVGRGDNFLAAAVLIGKKAPAPAAHVCKSADVQLAKK